MEGLLQLVLDSVPSALSKAAYRRALLEFFSWFNRHRELGLTKATVQKFRTELEQRGLAPPSVNIRLSAIRRLAAEAADNGLMPPELAAGILRIKGARYRGAKIGTWLSPEQAVKLLSLPDRSSTKGRRDCALLSLLVGSGARRSELSDLSFGHLQMRDGRWVIADLLGKHGRIRTIPIPDWVKHAIDEWSSCTGVHEGYVLRRVNKAGHVSRDRLTPESVYKIVQHYAGLLGLRIVPHDLRRTHAKLAHKGGAALEQIRFALGHASVRTTEIYLGLKQDLKDAPCDHLNLLTEGL